MKRIIVYCPFCAEPIAVYLSPSVTMLGDKHCACDLIAAEVYALLATARAALPSAWVETTLQRLDVEFKRKGITV